MADSTNQPSALRWHHDRMIGESWKDYASRQAGAARAAEADRDKALAEVTRLRAQLAELSGQVAAALLGDLP